MKQVAVLGCGPWGTAVARLIAENVTNSDEFAETVMMYVHNEKHCGGSLADLINRLHMNPVYFPEFNLPANIVASCDLKDIVSRSDILAIAYPPRHIPWLLDNIQDFIAPQSYIITFCKGVILDHSKKEIYLISDLIRERTGRPCVAVIGATTAIEVALQYFTEATIGSTDADLAAQTKRLVQTEYFRLAISTDAVGVELCGALKNVVAIAAGIADGLRLGDNTRAAILRLGFWEMFEIMEELFPNRGVDRETISQSCGIAEVFACMAHRSDPIPTVGSDKELMNFTLGCALVADSLDGPDREREKIHSALLQLRAACVNGAEYAAMIYTIMRERNLLSKFPLFTAVHLICEQKLRPSELIEQLRTHPVHA